MARKTHPLPALVDDITGGLVGFVGRDGLEYKVPMINGTGIIDPITKGPLGGVTGNVASSGAGAYVASSYARWRIAKARVKAKTGFAKIIQVGDSTQCGTWANGTTNPQNGCWDIGPSMCMALALGTVDVPTQISSFVGDQNIPNGVSGNLYPQYNVHTAFGTGWASSTTTKTAGGYCFENLTTTNALVQFYVGSLYDTCDIYCATGPGNAQFTVSRVGGPTTTFDTNAAVPGISKFTYSSPGINVPGLSLAKTAGSVSATLQVLSMDIYDSTAPSIRVLQAGWASGSIADWVDTSTPVSSLNALKFMAGDLYTIRPGINDWVGGTPVATYQANLDATVAGLLTVGDVMIITPFPSQITRATTSAQRAIVAATYAVAQKYSLYVQDTFAKIKTWEINNQLLYQTNDLHPNKNMYQRAGEWDAAAINSL